MFNQESKRFFQQFLAECFEQLQYGCCKLYAMKHLHGEESRTRRNKIRDPEFYRVQNDKTRELKTE
jgi:hypothetical protein